MLRCTPSAILDVGCVSRDSRIEIVRTSYVAELSRRVEAIVDRHVRWVGNLLQLSAQAVIIAERERANIGKRARLRRQLRKLIVAVDFATKTVSHRSPVPRCVIAERDIRCRSNATGCAVSYACRQIPAVVAVSRAGAASVGDGLHRVVRVVSGGRHRGAGLFRDVLRLQATVTIISHGRVLIDTACVCTLVLAY